MSDNDQRYRHKVVLSTYTIFIYGSYFNAKSRAIALICGFAFTTFINQTINSKASYCYFFDFHHYAGILHCDDEF